MRAFAATVMMLSQVLVAALCAAQHVPSPQSPLQGRDVDLTNEVPLPGLPFTGVWAYPFVCSSDGDIYVSAYVLDKTGRGLPTLPDLDRVSSRGEIKQIHRPSPSDYMRVESPSFFAGGSTLVTLIRATQPMDSGGQSHPGRDFFLSITDSDGDHPQLIHLDLDFNPMKAAGFDSGSFIVLGSDRTFEPVVALLNHDGKLIRRLNVFRPIDEQFKSEGDDGANDPARKRMDLFYAIGTAQMVPWGSDMLMVTPGIGGDSVVYRFRDNGDFDRVDVHLPAGQQIIGILGISAKDTWVVRTRSSDAARKFARAHIVENPEEALYEINPMTGELLRQLEVKGPAPGEVACAADGKLTAIFLSRMQTQGVHDKLVLASASR